MGDMEHVEEFVAEGQIEIGPREDYFTFLDSEHLGKLLLDHFGLPAQPGYTGVGRVRVTVELLEAPKPSTTFSHYR
jgi:hypothetical protein